MKISQADMVSNTVHVVADCAGWQDVRIIAAYADTVLA